MNSDPATRPEAEGAGNSCFGTWQDSHRLSREGLRAGAFSATLDSAVPGSAIGPSVLRDPAVPASEHVRSAPLGPGASGFVGSTLRLEDLP